MTVSCETRRFTYACDGETRKWPVEFNYIDGGTVKVFLISAGGDESEVKNITVSGGYVTAPATGEPFAAGNSVRVERILPFTQLDDYTAQGNFTPENTRKAVEMVGGRVELESSGGITFDTLRDYAECGVDYISVGALTHSVKGLDMSFKAC